MKIKGFKLGATGRYPYGKADATDEGELRMALAADHGNGIVRVEFGTPTAWLGLPAREARALAAGLIKKADELPVRCLPPHRRNHEQEKARPATDATCPMGR